MFEYLSTLRYLQGPQIAVYFLVFVGLIFAGLFRFSAVSGIKKFEAREAEKLRLAEEKKEDESRSFRLLEKQVGDLESKVTDLTKEIHQMREDEEDGKEYRHALVNQNQILVSYLELAIDLLKELSVWCGEDLPDYFRMRIDKFKTPGEILKNTPLPKRSEHRNE